MLYFITNQNYVRWLKAGEEVRNNLRNSENDWDMKEIELVDGVEISRKTSLKMSNINIDPNQKNKVNRYNNILRNGLTIFQYLSCVAHFRYIFQANLAKLTQKWLLFKEIMKVSEKI